MSERDLPREHYLPRFRSFERALGTQEPAWLAALRSDAIGRFVELGFPTTRLEEWRYTNVAALARQPFEPGAGPASAVERDEVESIAFPLFACALFVFVNGRFEPALSTPMRDGAGPRVASLARLRRERPELLEPHLGRYASHKLHPFAALNLAFVDDGAVVIVPKGEATAQPVHLVFLGAPGHEPTLNQPRVLVVAERGSRAVVIQDHVSTGATPGFTNAVSEVCVGPDASVKLVLLQREHPASAHVSNLHCRLERGARFASHTLTLGGALVRNDLTAVLADEGAECTLDGLFLGIGDGVVDNHTLVDHALPHGRSEELYKGILGGRSRGVFRGRVVVRPDAQGTDARQSNPNVLLGDGAEIDTKPQLEIHADDVKCSHGSSIGCLDPDALFYLRSRGLGEPQARDLLIRGFAAQILERMQLPSLADAVSELLLERLRAAGAPS